MSANKTTRRFMDMEADILGLKKTLARLVQAHNDFIKADAKESEQQKGALLAIINRMEEIAPSKKARRKSVVLK